MKKLLVALVFLSGCVEPGAPFTDEWNCAVYEKRLAKDTEIIELCQSDASCVLTKTDYVQFRYLREQVIKFCNG